MFAWLEVLVGASKEARQGISVVQVRPRVWKRLRDPQGSDSGLPGAKLMRVHQEAEGHDPGFARVGIG